MAYLDLSIGSPTVEARRAQAQAMTPIGLSAIERRVVLLSRRDDRSSLSQPGTIGRLLRRVAGVRQVNPLADERLETLRQFAVSMRLNDAGRLAVLGAQLEALGVSAAALTQVRGMVEGFSAQSKAVERGQTWAATGVLAAISGSGYAFSASYFNDGQLGAVTAGIVFAMLAPVLLSQNR